MAVILFGAPGSGKGTQARLLEQWAGIPQISTGDILRQHVAARDEIGVQVARIMDSGLLAPDELIHTVIRERVGQPDCAAGFILDGFPRTLAQACFLAGLLKEKHLGEVVIHLLVDYNVIIARLAARRQCPRCGALYNLISNPPQTDALCDRDGSALVARDDDREEVIRRRMREYENETKPILEYFRAAGFRIFDLEASHDAPEALFERIRRLIEADV